VRLLQQLLPQTLGVLAKYRLDVGPEHRPQAVVDLAPQLARAPADVADVVARLVRRGLDHVVDGRRAKREVQVLRQGHRATRVAACAHQRHQRVARKRSAVVHGLANPLRGLVLGKQAAQRAPGGPVQDHADVPAIGRGTRDDHGLRVVGIAQPWLGDQQHRRAFTVLGVREPARQGEQGADRQRTQH